MSTYNQDKLTQDVVEAFGRCTDARLRVLMTSLVKHVHAFAREVDLTPDEWLAGLKFVDATGRICSDKRPEFILLSDTLGLSMMVVALAQARAGRLHILGEMAKALDAPRTALSRYAPRIITIKIRPDKIGDIIGPKGKIIRGIQEETGAQINVEDDGTVTISAVDGAAGERARDLIAAIVQEPEVGKVYEGVVKSTTAFGAFVEILPGTEGLLHISELAHNRVEKTEDVVKKGDTVRVKLLEVDSRGKMRLSRKALLDQD